MVRYSMPIIDETGIALDARVRSAILEICDRVDALFKDCFKSGMTPNEGRLLLAHLKGNVDISATIQILQNQAK